MGEIKVSVIVPVYNAAAFLEKNLLILSKQTLEEIEFICVNDKSTDNSLNILKAFKEVFPDKFVVIDSDRNRGPGGARNIGLSYARGEYIGFMDNDDYCHPDMYKILYNEAKTRDFDIVNCGYYDKASDSAFTLDRFRRENLTDKEKMDMLRIGFVWNRIFKRELVSKMSIWFRENVINDDTDFFFEAVCMAKTAASIQKTLYYFNFNGASMSRNVGQKDMDIENKYKYREEVWNSIRERAKPTHNEELAEMYIDYSVKKGQAYRNILYAEFSKPDFSLKDMKRYHLFAAEYCPEYYKIKFDAAEPRNIVYNCLENDVNKSYENLMKLKGEI